MKKFQVSYKNLNSEVFTGYYDVQARTDSLAIGRAKNRWIEDWNLSFPYNPNGESEVSKVVFVITNKG
jgi:hypothetical protein